jgi:hypothetical protein
MEFEIGLGEIELSLVLRMIVSLKMSLQMRMCCTGGAPPVT